MPKFEFHAGPKTRVEMLNLKSLSAVIALFVLASSSPAVIAQKQSGAADSKGIAAQRPKEGRFVKVGDQFMVPYTERIPGTDITFEMIPVPGGKYLMGSPSGEPNRNADEGPVVFVEVNPMWVAKCEVTQAEYDQYVDMYDVMREYERTHGAQVTLEHVDAMTTPTPLYEPLFIYEFGRGPKLPAISMTQFAAQQYTKWLSAMVGAQYRLPTEAEWEYACRAGSAKAFSWGEDVSKSDLYAWSFDSEIDHEGYSTVGSKKPNAFGLHDMLGNVGEWTVNAYTKSYDWLGDREQPVNAIDVVKWPVRATSCVVRGGQWEDDAKDVRCAVRLESDDDEWKMEDPDFPRSPWWFTSDPARGVGFRLFRSYKPLDDELIKKFWNHTSEKVKQDVQMKLDSGHSQIGLANENLLPAIKEYRRKEMEWKRERERRRRERENGPAN